MKTKLNNTAYCIISRQRKRSDALRVDTRNRTVEVKYGRLDVADCKPIARLEKEFGFVVQQFI